jgi:hypothetical protein
MYDHGSRGGTAEPPEGFDPILISPDQTLQLDPGDIGAGRREPVAWHEQPNCAGNGKEGYRQRTGTPKCKLTPYTATIDDGVGIERHDFAPSIQFHSNRLLRIFLGHPVCFVITTQTPG